MATMVGAQAANFMWGGGVGPGDGTSWNSASNWHSGAFGNGVPNTNDHAQLESYLFTTNNQVTSWPVLNTVASNVSVLTWGWDTTNATSLTVKHGGTIHATALARIGSKIDSSGTLDMTGGIVTINALEVGHNASTDVTSGGPTGGSGIVNLSVNAVLHAGTLQFGQEMADYNAGDPNLDGTGQINMEGSARFIVNGDQTGTNWIANGYIAPAIPGESIVATYDSANARTEFTVEQPLATVLWDDGFDPPTSMWDEDFSAGTLNTNWSVFAPSPSSVTQTGGQLIMDTGETTDTLLAAVYTLTNEAGTVTTYNGAQLYDFYDHQVSTRFDIASMTGTPDG
ncbi:MAG: hypothetical protein ABFR33_09520, partial [Verrucomicrobiota bacterium]